MLMTLLFSVVAAASGGNAVADESAARDAPASTAAPAAQATAGAAATFSLSCMYADQGEGGGLEAAEHCARLEGDTLVLSPKLLERMDFSGDGLSPLFTNRSWHWVRRDGHAVPVVTYDNMADDFVDGLARGPWQGGMAYYDTQLKRVITTPYDWVDRFEGGLAQVCKGCRRQTTPDGEHWFMTGGEWGAIDRQGRLVQPLQQQAATR